MKLEYKPIAVQDECFGGTKDSPEMTVLIKLAAQGKRNVLYKNTAMSFPDANYLDKYINENKLEVVPEGDFRANNVD